MRIRVPRGTTKPYCLDDSRIYLRLESDTVQAVRDEIVRLVRRALRVEHGELVEPVKQPSPAPAEAGKGRGRQRRGSGEGKQPSAEPPAAPAAAAVPAPEEPANGEPLGRVGAEPSQQAPKVGVQIVNVRERGGIRYYTIRDLRNGASVQNVTLKSARRLWRYAISQHEQAAPKADHPVGRRCRAGQG